MSTDAPDDYGQQLARAGYGPEARQQYVTTGPGDAEYNAQVWDNLIIPAAVAAGEIGQDQGIYAAEDWARLDARQHALGEWLHEHPEYDPLDNSAAAQDEFRQALAFVERRSRTLLQDQHAETVQQVMSGAQDTAADDEGDDV